MGKSDFVNFLQAVGALAKAEKKSKERQRENYKMNKKIQRLNRANFVGNYFFPCSRSK